MQVGVDNYMVTIYDIANKAGVSIATVSKALNGYPDISQNTVKKIQRLCKEMGFRPNSAARSLSAKKSSTIGIFFKDHLNSGFKDPFYLDVMGFFKETVGSAGYDLVFFSDDSPNSNNNYYDRARYRNVDGLFLLGVQKAELNVNDLAQSNLPCIAIDLELIGPRLGFISSDNIGVALKAVNHLMEMGHTDIAFISDFSTKIGQDCFIGFQTAMKQYKFPVISNWIVHGDSTESGGYQSCLRLLENKQLPTAIFSSGDFMALGVIRALIEKGLKVPGDMSVVGYNDLDLLKYVNPGLTTIRQEKEQLGKRTANELLKMIRDPNYFPVSSSSIETELVVRESVKRRDGSLNTESYLLI